MKISTISIDLAKQLNEASQNIKMAGRVWGRGFAA